MPYLFSQSGGMTERGTMPFHKNEYGFVIGKASCNNYKSWIVMCINVFVSLQIQKQTTREVLIFVSRSLQRVVGMKWFVPVMALQNKNL